MAIRYPIVPNNITIHLGAPSENARNITVPFTDYISNVASSEIYPTWPKNAIIANVYAIISFAMNRIYNEWYRSKGYNFDITSNPTYDQTYTENRSTYENINNIVLDIFDNYVVKGNQVQPYFTTYCDGRVTTCNGLSQWGTVNLANQAIPVSGLKIFVNKKINGYNVNFYEGFTNESGVIENIGLPAPKLDSNDLVAPRSASYELIAIYNQTTLNFIVNVYDNLYVIQNISILPNMQGGN